MTSAGSLEFGDVSIHGGGVKVDGDVFKELFNEVRRNGQDCVFLFRKADKAHVRHLTDPAGAVGD